MTPTIPTPALADLPEHRLDYIARQYFADEQYQHYVKHAISDAFQEARRAAQPNSPEFGGIAAQPVAPVQENSKREGFEAAAKALQERAAGHKRDGEYELYEECLECVSMLHDLKPAATPSPQIAEVAEPMAWMRKTDITELTDSEPETEGWTPLYATPAPASAGQAAPASADAAGANEMRIALVTQLNELIDLGNRYAGRMRDKDDDESEYAQGACEYARRVMAPYNYNGGYRPTADEQDAKRYRYIATLRDWSDIEQMCWSSTARSASQFKRDLDKYIDAKLVKAAPDQACVMREVAMPKGLTRYSMWSNAAAHGMDPSPSGEWVAFDELQDYLAAQPAEGAKQAGQVAKLADALNTMLWLYRRLPGAYGKPPFVDAALVDLAAIAGVDGVPDAIKERAALLHATDQPSAQVKP